MQQRHYTGLDRLMVTLDTGLRSVFGRPLATERENPARAVAEGDLSAEQRELAGRLMRINHAGEVAAQGLYQGQALTAKLPEVRVQMERAAQEENDHLLWCRTRASEVGSRVSYLDPLWYGGSLAIGALAGFAGDRWSLGFVAETERQVVRHLDEQLQQLPEQDSKSRAILEQMRVDEGLHATLATQAGGRELPMPIRGLMRWTAKLMTKGAYWL